MLIHTGQAEAAKKEDTKKKNAAMIAGVNKLPF